MRKYFFNNHHLLTLKKFYILYLIISSSIINSEIKIFPEHYEHADEIFSTSQVTGVTYERFYYDIGYFTQTGERYHSPKYGIDFLPIECWVITDDAGNEIGELLYKIDDRDSFFGDIDGKPIRVTDSTRSNKNKVEETKLYQNTMRGYNFRCPSPFLLFHTTDFEITYKLPMISDTGMTLSVQLHMVKNDGTSTNEEICTMELEANVFTIMEMTIIPKTRALEGNYVNTEYICNNVLKTIRTKEPIKFYLDFIPVPDTSTNKYVTFSNYRVTIEDQIIKTGTEYQTSFVRSRNGLNTCDKDGDCFVGFMCLGHKCLQCHSSCLRCTVDITESNARNYCSRCNALSVSQTPSFRFL